jgi:hypothetical protein
MVLSAAGRARRPQSQQARENAKLVLIVARPVPNAEFLDALCSRLVLQRGLPFNHFGQAVGFG